ncbi:MAG: penicillin-insensitive murein endopeptidase [Myxococcales bacterium]|nr:penicillin-insensitive murein endopeptidase [Myxococcales bacterium]
MHALQAREAPPAASARVHDEAPTPAAPVAAAPAKAQEVDALAEVFWIAPQDGTLAELASHWGIPADQLIALNPDHAPPEPEEGERRRKPLPAPVVPAGARLRVFKKDPAEPTRSVGAPNRGRLVSGIPMPEGDEWTIRKNRRRVYGTHKTISTLVNVFHAYGQRYPDGPKIHVGEIARRRGGRARPHKSHRTGRDVDIRYIQHGDDGKPGYRRTTSQNFDLERNWFLVQSLIETGNVQAIYMSSKRQRQIYPEAKKHLSEEELKRYFQYPFHDESHKAIIRHQSGHKNHLHVRFRCEDWNGRCRARSRSHKKKPATS